MKHLCFLVCVLVLLVATTVACGDDPPAESRAGQRALGTTSADGGVGNVALAGEDALLLDEDENTLSVRRVPLDGSGSGTALTVRLPGDKIPTGQLTASDAVAALVVHTETSTSGLGDGQVFRGPASGRLVALGPLRPLRPKAFFAGRAQADENRLFVTEFRSDLQATRHVLYEGRRQPQPVRLPSSVMQADFAGDLVAYEARAGRPHRLVIRNWRTGERRSVTTLRAEIETFDLAANGRVVVAEEDGGVSEIRPGEPLRRVARSGARPIYAGTRIAYVQRAQQGPARDRVAIIEPGGTTRVLDTSLGPTIDDLTANDHHVVWVSGGCAFASSVSAATGSKSRGCSR